jgi:large repetitive protein
MKRTKVIILSVLALLGFASLAAAATTIYTSTTVKPVVTLRYYNSNSGINVVHSYPSTGANFLVLNQDAGRDLFMTLRASNGSGLNVMAEAIGMGVLLPTGANTAVLSWQDSLDAPVFEFPNAMTMAAQSAIIKGSYRVNATQIASGNFSLDVAGTLSLADGSTVPARMTATFSSGAMPANTLAGYSTISRPFTPPPPQPFPPTAAPQTASMAFGATAKINLLNGAKSFQTIPGLTPTIVSPPANGNLSSIDSKGNVVYTPNSNFTGADVFSFTVTDSAGLTSAVQLVTVTVTGGPSAKTLVLKVDKNSAGTAAATPIDFSSLNLGSNIVQSVTGAKNGTVTQTGGDFFYTPNKGITGFDTLTYTLAANASSAAFATGEVDVEVCPIAVNYFQQPTGSSAQVNVLTDDIPFNTNDTLTVTLHTTQAPLYGTLVQSGTGGGVITYTLSGAIPAGVTEDTFPYTITESNTGQTSTGVVTILLQ